MAGSAEHAATPYHQRLRRAILDRDHGGAPVAEGDGFLYRPGELLVAADDVPRVSDHLRQISAHRDDDLAAHPAPVHRFFLPDRLDAREHARRLRTPADAAEPPPRVHLNHVFLGTSARVGPHHVLDTPRNSTDRSQAARSPAGLGTSGQHPHTARVAVLDTGLPAAIGSWHPVLASAVVAGGPDTDVLDEDGDGLLDLQAGHGCFVAGIVRQLSPTSYFDPEAVLNSFGIGDELAVRAGLARISAPIVNLSLGGYTQDDLPPVALAGVIDALWPDRVVVAAAGNHGSTRPFWPAAFTHVIGVAALDTTHGDLRRAEFSNYGDWVDACAPGVHIRGTYVRGRWQHDTDPPATFDRYACWSGTSFAAPQVAAVIAQRMVTDGVCARVAAHRVIGDVGRPVLRSLGAVVLPELDLVCPERHLGI